MLRFCKWSFFILAFFISSMLVITWLATSDTPLVAPAPVNFLDHADQADALLKQLQTSIKQRDDASTILITEAQLKSLQGLLQRAAISLNTDASINTKDSVITLSWGFQRKRVKRYLNAQIRVTAGTGLNIASASMGSLRFSGKVTTLLLTRGLNFYTHSQVGSRLVETVNSIELAQGSAKVKLHPLGPLLNELRRVKTGSQSEENKQLEYYTATFMRELEQYEANKQLGQSSLNDYMVLVFSKAASIRTEDNVILLNEAAILSLAIFAGHYRIGTFVGDVQLNVDQPSVPQIMPTLGARTDLSQHFIISAALHILSQRGLSLAIGEFKELMDRAKGGSGYSFVDLAADAAGVKFAEAATNQEHANTILLRFAAGLTEEDYFPNIDGLIEGLNKHAFEQKFGSIESEAYKNEVHKVRLRIQKLALYNS